MLPEGWDTRKLGEVCRLWNGKAYRKEELLENGKYLVLRVGNFFTSDRWYYSDLELEDEKYCEDGDLLYAWSASFGPRIWAGGKAIYHYHIWKIVVDDRLIDKDFLFHFLDWDAELIKKSMGSGSTMIHVTKGAMEERAICLPPLDEQRRIAEVLQSVDEAIAANRESVDQIRSLRSALRNQLFATSDPSAEAQKLGEICSITKLAGFEYSKYFQYGEAGEIIAVRGLNIKEGRIVLDDVKTVSLQTSTALPRSKLRSGDLVLSYVGTIGEAAIIREDNRYHLAPNVAMLRCKKDIIPEYLLHYIYSQAGRDQIESHTSRSSQSSLSMEKIRSFEIYLPNIDAQQAACRQLNDIETSLHRGMETLETLTAKKAALMAAVLSGRVRVPA